MACLWRVQSVHHDMTQGHHVSDADRRQTNSVSDLLCTPLVVALESESMQAPSQESDPRPNFRITTSDLPVVANPLGYIVRRERSNSLDEDDEHEVLRGVLPSKEDGDGPFNRGSGLWRAVCAS